MTILQIDELIKEGKYPEALDSLASMLASTTLDFEVQCRLKLRQGSVWAKTGHYKEALDCILTILADHSLVHDDAIIVEAQLIKADALGGLGEFTESLATLNVVERLLNSFQLQPNDQERFKEYLITLRGITYLFKGDLEHALTWFFQGLEMAKQQGNSATVAKFSTNIGYVFDEKGDLTQAYDYYLTSYSIEKKNDLNTRRPSANFANVVNNIAYIRWRQGELDEALEHYQEALTIYRQKEDSEHISMCYSNIALIFLSKGELDLALEHETKALAITEQLGIKKDIATSYMNLGDIFQAKGKTKDAMNYFQQALDIRSSLGNEIALSTTLFRLIGLCVEQKQLPEANQYLGHLEQLKRDQSRNIEQEYLCSKAIILKNGVRLREKVKAQELFEQVINDTAINYEIITYAMLNLFDLLLYELQILDGEEHVLKEIKTLSEKLITIAAKQNSYSLLAQTYLLQSKLALLELQVQPARELLLKARITAESKGLWKLAIVIASEYDTLEQQLNRWNELIETQAPMIKRFQLAQIEGMIVRMVQRRIDDVTNLPQFAVEHIYVSLFRMGMAGPEVMVTEKLPYAQYENVLLKMGLFYTVSLGQGNGTDINLGLFGPLPIPTVADHVSLVYAFKISDPDNTDHRCNGRSFSFIVFSMPQSLIHFFTNRDAIHETLQTVIQQTPTIHGLTLPVIQALKYQILGLKPK